MSFTSKKLQSRKGTMSFIKGATLFFLGMSCIFFIARAFDVVPIAPNAIQYIQQIFLTNDGSNSPLAITGIILDGSLTGGITITNLTGQVVLGTDSNGKIIGSTSGDVYNFMSGFALSGPTGAVGPTGAKGDTGNTGPQGPIGDTGFLQAGILGATPFWNGSSWTTTDANIFNTGDNVGIGTTTPKQKLEVGGNIRLTSFGYLEAGVHPNQLYLSSVNGNVGINTSSTTDNKLTIDGNITSDGFIARGQGVVVTVGSFSTAMGSFAWAIGKTSTAMGDTTVALGTGSTAMGYGTTASGDYSTAMGKNTNAYGKVSTAMGQGTTASGDYSTAMGQSTIASGNYSTAMGWNTRANGDHSTAMGSNTAAHGIDSAAMGQSTTASGARSTAMGLETTASGLQSTSMGDYTIANATNSLAIGTFNVGLPTSIFEIGIGHSTGPVRENALTVRSDGYVTVGGGTTPTTGALFTVEGGIQAISLPGDGICGTSGYPEGTIFYNNTNHYPCFCNNAGAGKKMDGTTACY